MTKQLQAIEIFTEVAERCGREFGVPLPQRLLQVGDQDSGWCVKLNPTREKVEAVEPICAAVSYNGWPAGLVTPRTGFFAAGEAANTASFVEWLRSDLPSLPEEPPRAE
jgi:hypothetical protein